MIFSDWHIHSEYSYDASNKLETIAENAKEHGLKWVGITDHLNYNDKSFIGDLTASANAVKEAQEKYPYMVCLLKDRIVGYAYAGPYSSREAYNWTATTSIYVDKDYRRQGIGTAMYKAIEPRLKEMGIVNLLAGTAYCEQEDEYLTHASSLFHMSQGYSEAAHFKNIGKKFDRWYDLKWYQKGI